LAGTAREPDLAPPGRAARAGAPPGSQVLFTGEEIRAAVDRLAGEIRAVYGEEELTLVAVLHGGLVFAADLLRRLDMPVRLGVVFASSYRGPSTEPGELHVQLSPDLQLRGRHVLLLDDILDTGRTLMRLRDELRMLAPRSLRIVTLVDKPSRRLVPLQADFTGFTIPDLFVVGYGLDWNERWRNLPDIVALPPGTGAAPAPG
jgi:hypoxanthine phosphoribosyltransferase